MSTDRSWMYHRLNKDGYVSDNFKAGVKQFLDFIFSQSEFIYRDKIRCPCLRFTNLFFHNRDDITVHLYRKGFIGGYTTWDAHGESYAVQASSGNNDIPLMDNVNSYRSMVMDALGPEFNWHAGGFDEMSFENEQPNAEAAKFYDLLNDADEPLWEGCKKHTKLSAVYNY